MLFQYIQDLIVEPSRRCRADCPHCLRGEPQDLCISKRVMTAFLKGLAPDAAVSALSFGGGEPALAVTQIRLIRQAFAYAGIPYYSFFLATGGFAPICDIRSLAAEALMLRAGCYEREPELCMLALSQDQFHPKVHKEIKRILSGLSFFDDKIKAAPQNSKRRLIKEGRAALLPESPDYELKPLEPHNFQFDSIELKDDLLTVTGGTLYLCANGNIVNCCDLSYEHADADPICSVFDPDWPAKWYAVTKQRAEEDDKEANTP